MSMEKKARLWGWDGVSVYFFFFFLFFWCRTDVDQIALAPQDDKQGVVFRPLSAKIEAIWDADRCCTFSWAPSPVMLGSLRRDFAPLGIDDLLTSGYDGGGWHDASSMLNERKLDGRSPHHCPRGSP